MGVRRPSMVFWIGAAVMLIAALAFAFGPGLGGSSESDDIVDAYRDSPDGRSAVSQGLSEEGLRLDALDLTAFVCSLDPEVMDGSVMGNTTVSLESAIAVAEVGCPDVADALRDDDHEGFTPSGSSNLGDAFALCETHRPSAAGDEPFTIGAGGGRAADLADRYRAAGLDPSPWDRVPADRQVVSCSYGHLGGEVNPDGSPKSTTTSICPDGQVAYGVDSDLTTFFIDEEGNTSVDNLPPEPLPPGLPCGDGT